MARAIWTGSLSFGLVNVPVGLYSATEDRTIHFHQFEEGTDDRIRYKRVNEATGEEVPYAKIVKGYEVGDGQYVILTKDELERAEPGRSRAIEITDFVDAAEIDPIFYSHSYYLAPSDQTAARAYGLLLHAMEKANRIAVATFVMRTKQYLAAIRPDRNVLALETMFFADEVRDPAEELDTLPAEQHFSGRDLDTAVALVTSMTVPWQPETYHDTYRERVMELVDAKRQGLEVVDTEQPVPATTVVDLMDALRRSVEAAKARRGGKPERSAPAGDDLAGKSRQELYAMAQQLGISGRSKMDAEHLAAAIRDVRAEAKAS